VQEGAERSVYIQIGSGPPSPKKSENVASVWVLTKTAAASSPGKDVWHLQTERFKKRSLGLISSIEANILREPFFQEIELLLVIHDIRTM